MRGMTDWGMHKSQTQFGQMLVPARPRSEWTRPAVPDNHRGRKKLGHEWRDGGAHRLTTVLKSTSSGEGRADRRPTAVMLEVVGGKHAKRAVVRGGFPAAGRVAFHRAGSSGEGASHGRADQSNSVAPDSTRIELLVRLISL